MRSQIKIQADTTSEISLPEGELILPSPPQVAVRVLSALQNSDNPIAELSEIISADPALAGKTLKLANSSFYSLPNKVTNIQRAITILGTNLVKNIALSFIIANDPEYRKADLQIESYWKRSVTAAVAAELLTQKLARQDEDIFVCGLLHNIGTLIIYMQRPDEMRGLLDRIALSQESPTELEKSQFGTTHQEIGALLIRQWGLPETVYLPIRYHHIPDEAPAGYRDIALILNLADQISAIYSDPESGTTAHALQAALARHYSFEKNSSIELLDEIAERSVEILKTFEIDAGDIKPYSQMLQEANQQLGRLNLSYEQLVIELKEAKEKSDRLANALKVANERLSNLAYTDSLTGLYNHRYFQQQLNTEIARGTRYGFPVSLVLFDIDYFKSVNDRFGHLAGDNVLIAIARTVGQIVRPSDMVARYGGEEFAIILPQTDLGGLSTFATRLRRAVEQIVTRYEGHEILVTISVGGTTFSPDQTGINKEQLIDTADRGLYMSKGNGRNQVTILAIDNVPG